MAICAPSLAGLIDSLPQRPKAILIASAHWEEDVATVGSLAMPTMIYDYIGFPPHTYQIRHAAAGDPSLAQHVLKLLREAGVPAAEDTRRGFDQGVFVPMMVIDPPAQIPVVTLSIRRDFDPAAHLAMGRALRTLHEGNVLVLGSGNSFHSLSTFRDGKDANSAMFDDWLTNAMADPSRREEAPIGWEDAPGARGPPGARSPVASHDRSRRSLWRAQSGRFSRCDDWQSISGYRLG